MMITINGVPAGPTERGFRFSTLHRFIENPYKNVAVVQHEQIGGSHPARGISAQARLRRDVPPFSVPRGMESRGHTLPGDVLRGGGARPVQGDLQLRSGTGRLSAG